jgi:Na+-translocating ferredoxin:NAD+ oxidoreductase RNF subunit RnfB
MGSIYEKVRERLDKFPQGFPKTASGVELEILKTLFSPEEAELLLFLSPAIPAPASAIAGKAGKEVKETEDVLYRMSQRGLIFRLRPPGAPNLYFLVPWVVGIWEFQLKNLNLDNIHLFERYHEEGMVSERKRSKTGGFRVVPVEKEIQQMAGIEPYEKVSEIINANTRFAVAECICRKESKMLGKGCDKLLEACMMFGVAADYYIENGLGREITKEEAKKILAQTEEEGLVHCSSNHAGNKMLICNCCGCCCKALGYINKYNIPTAVAHSNYYAQVDEKTCAGCESCLDRCQVKAIQMENDHALVSKDRCIGCGLCVSSCPTESISMIHKRPDEVPPLFLDGNALIQAMAKEKNKPFPFD